METHFFIEIKLFYSFTDWAHFLNSIFAAICRIRKSAVYLNTPLGFEFQSPEHLFVVPCLAHPHLRGARGKKFEKYKTGFMISDPENHWACQIVSSVFIFLHSTPTLSLIHI